ncbi:MAG: riboflavin synthase [Acidobacteriota bacterium]|jgi:riboflavin synthase|nr:riboflavin synthase [Acidobacteriota bacterium]
MFTGIVEEVGTIRELRFQAEGAAITVAAKNILPGIVIGDSVAVNGVCLTAVRLLTDAFVCDISEETLQRSAFRNAGIGARVNLERALAVNGRLGGHIMQGHVDDVGRMISRTPSGGGFEISFSFPCALERYLVYKGSIAVNGISLTIAALGKESFSAAVIPHTLSATNLGELKPGDPVNLETDILGKYFERYFQLGLAENPESPHGSQKTESRLTVEYLVEQGF